MRNGIVPDQSAIDTALAVDGGFTFDPRSGAFLRPVTDGIEAYAIAIPGTESVDVAELIENATDDAFIGGWIDRNGVTIVELSELWAVTREQAMLIGRARNQLAILDFRTGEAITVTPALV